MPQLSDSGMLDPRRAARNYVCRRVDLALLLAVQRVAAAGVRPDIWERYLHILLLRLALCLPRRGITERQVLDSSRTLGLKDCLADICKTMMQVSALELQVNITVLL